MSTWVEGFKPPDETFDKMKAVYESCQKAEIKIPENVLEYFDYREPDENGVLIESDKIPYEHYNEGESRQGIEVDLTKLPKDIKILRFVNAW